MKLHFLGAETLAAGIALVSEELGIETVSANADCTVTVREVEKDTLCVSLNGESAEIIFGGGKARFFRGLATEKGLRMVDEYANEEYAHLFGTK